jgi:Zn-dependent alcohol dehydrogenase
VDLEGSKEKIALEIGATHFIDSSKEDPVPKIQELTEGRGADYAFECIGDPGAQVQAYWALRQGGKLVLEGIAPIASTTSLPMFFIALQERSVLGTCYGSMHNQLAIPRLVEMYKAGLLKPDKMITRNIKLEEVNDAYDMMRKRQIVGRWVVMME